MSLKFVKTPKPALERLVKAAQDGRINWIATTYSVTTPTPPQRLVLTPFYWRLRWYSVARRRNGRFMLFRLGCGEFGQTFILLFEREHERNVWESIMIYPDPEFRASAAMRKLYSVYCVRGIISSFTRAAYAAIYDYGRCLNDKIICELEDFAEVVIQNCRLGKSGSDIGWSYFIETLRYLEAPSEETLLGLESLAVMVDL